MFLSTEIEAGDKGLDFKAFAVGRICTVCTESTTDPRHDLRGGFVAGADCTGMYKAVQKAGTAWHCFQGKYWAGIVR